MKIFDEYIVSLREFDVSDVTEHSYRSSLESLIRAIAKENDNSIKVLHEPKKDKKFGAPDFIIKQSENIIGYVENKKLEENLDKTLKTEQLKKYKELSDNIILTNYLEWVWIRDGEILKRESLCSLSDLENKKKRIDTAKINSVKSLIEAFLSQVPKGISDIESLAFALAVRAKHLKVFLLEELNRQNKEHKEGKLYGLYTTFKEQVFHELLLTEFTDAFAQVLVYGLFLAKLNSDEKITLYNAKKYISDSFKLIKELVDFLDELEKPEYRYTKWIVEEVLTIINNLDLESLLRKLSFNRKTTNEDDYHIRDPYVYFYEDFIKEYDKELRISRGVYYTPPPIVNFIIKVVNDTLKDNFDIQDGLANRQKVTVLDFATGTGTFLVEILNQIFDSIPSNSGKRDLVIKEHILKNIYGFEYLIAPYTIAHLKLSQFLKDKGYKMEGNDRFQVFLTNTLEPIDKQMNIGLLPELSHETKAAQQVKDNPVLVITGNPPYNNRSSNIGWINKKIEDYKPIDEKKINLDDDYIKFIRFAHHKMQDVPRGIIAIITNNSFLNGITHRKMRGLLRRDFNKIYILNLHGNTRVGEKVPDGIKDENVFDIQQGVSINIFIKDEQLQTRGEVYYQDLWGSRNDKYKTLYNRSFPDIGFEKIDPDIFNNEFSKTRWSNRFADKLDFFIPLKNCAQIKNYGEFYGVAEIFKHHNTGIQTKRDKVSIAFDSDSITKVIHDFVSLNIELLRQNYNLPEDGRDWTIENAKNDLINKKHSIVDILYRPFDVRKTVFTGTTKGFVAYPRRETMLNFINKENLGLVTIRNHLLDSAIVCFITDKIIEKGSLATSNYSLFPLYLYEEDMLGGGKIENIKPEFRKFIDGKYQKHYSPEDILNYIYAVMYSPVYRDKYSELLTMDFPRIPFSEDQSIFEKLTKCGGELIDVHLMKMDTPFYNIGSFKGSGNNQVEYVKYSDNKLHINKTQYFDAVPDQVYNFYIGGYQVLNKYLDERKKANKILTLEEIEMVEKITNIIAYTKDKMKEIDVLTSTWI
jgi:hypothetical protein